MNDHDLHGPFFTYLTDEDLDRESQEHVIREFVKCSSVLPLRVAFRLPRLSDVEYVSLLEWYLKLVDETGAKMEPALVHDRPEVVNAYSNTRLWLPQRNQDLIRSEDIGRVAISVHSVQEAHDAIYRGASELVFGHVFRSESHPGQPGRGIAQLQAVADAIQRYANAPRLSAIGGIDEHTVPEIGVIRQASVVAMRTISRSGDIAGTLDRIRMNWIAARIRADLDDSQQTPFNRPSSLFF